jgi:hypothetical protein
VRLPPPPSLACPNQGKIKGSYTADKMVEFCKRGTLSARQMVLGIDRDLPYVMRQVGPLQRGRSAGGAERGGEWRGRGGGSKRGGRGPIGRGGPAKVSLPAASRGPKQLKPP